VRLCHHSFHKYDFINEPIRYTVVRKIDICNNYLSRQGVLEELPNMESTNPKAIFREMPRVLHFVLSNDQF
jgi:hypothetical protein